MPGPLRPGRKVTVALQKGEKMKTHDKHTETHACDYISREAAIEAVCAYCEYYYNENVIQSIKDIPAADVVERKWNTYYHGGTDFSYSCARCGYGAPFDMKGGKVFQKKWNYCPNCGADMRGETNED